MVPDIWHHYAATLVHVMDERVPEYVIAAADPGVWGDWPLATDDAWVITACNPASVPLGDDENARRHEELCRALVASGHRPIETVGRQAGGEWREPGVLVPGISREEALALGHLHGQNALFHWTPREWSIVGVLQPGHWSMGWCLTGPSAVSPDADLPLR